MFDGAFFALFVCDTLVPFTSSVLGVAILATPRPCPDWAGGGRATGHRSVSRPAFFLLFASAYVFVCASQPPRWVFSGCLSDRKDCGKVGGSPAFLTAVEIWPSLFWAKENRIRFPILQKTSCAHVYVGRFTCCCGQLGRCLWVLLPWGQQKITQCNAILKKQCLLFFLSYTWLSKIN